MAEKKKKPNWDKIRIEYETTKISLRKLAEKHGISFSTLKSHAVPERWADTRHDVQQEIATKTQRKTKDKLIDKIAEANALHFELNQKLLSIAKSALDDTDQFYKHIVKLRQGLGAGEFSEEITTEKLEAINSKALLNIAAVVEKASQEQRKILGIVDEKDKQKLEIERQRLEIEKSKADIGSDEDDDTGIILLPEVQFSPVKEGSDEPLDNTQE